MNLVILIGNLGGNPELKYTADQKAVTTFSVATEMGYGENKKAVWHRVVCWEKRAEAAVKLLQKGDKVAVRGFIQYREYEDRDGVKRNLTEIVSIDFIDLLSRKNPQGENQKPAQQEKKSGGKSDQTKTKENYGGVPVEVTTYSNDGVLDDLPF